MPLLPWLHWILLREKRCLRKQSLSEWWLVLQRFKGPYWTELWVQMRARYVSWYVLSITMLVQVNAVPQVLILTKILHVDIIVSHFPFVAHFLMKNITICWIVTINWPNTHIARRSKRFAYFCLMKASSNENIFRVIGPLCEQFTSDRWIPLVKASDEELRYFLWSALE